MLTLFALASMVPILGPDVVLGGQRRQIFSDKMNKEVRILFLFDIYFDLNIRMLHFRKHLKPLHQQILHCQHHRSQENQVR